MLNGLIVSERIRISNGSETAIGSRPKHERPHIPGLRYHSITRQLCCDRRTSSFILTLKDRVRCRRTDWLKRHHESEMPRHLWFHQHRLSIRFLRDPIHCWHAAFDGQRNPDLNYRRERPVSRRIGSRWVIDDVKTHLLYMQNTHQQMQ